MYNLHLNLCDMHVQTLRRLKESIRHYALSETLKNKEKESMTPSIHDYVVCCLDNYDLLITVGKHHKLPKPFEGLTIDEINQELIKLNRTHIHQQRMRKRSKPLDFPKALQRANLLIYGESLASFVLHQLSTRQSNSLWQILAFILQSIPTATAISLLNTYQHMMVKVQDVNHLDLALSAIIQSATYSVATALYLRYTHLAKYSGL